MTLRWLGLILVLVSLMGCASPSGWEAQPLDDDVAGACDTCGELTDEALGGVTWPDERLACERCLERAVVDDDAAREVFDEAHSELRDLLGLEHLAEARARLELTDRPRLLRLAGEVAHPDLRAFTEILEVVRGDEVESRRFSVHVLKGMPRACLLGILCHELFHVWQTLRGGIRQAVDPAFREGAAQFVQFRVLELRGETAWTERLLANPDPVYGGGLRRFRKLVADRGQEEALQLGATRGAFPRGF